MENDRAKILWDLQIHTDKQVMANQLDIVVVYKLIDNLIDICYDEFPCQQFTCVNLEAVCILPDAAAGSL